MRRRKLLAHAGAGILLFLLLLISPSCIVIAAAIRPPVVQYQGIHPYLGSVSEHIILEFGSNWDTSDPTGIVKDTSKSQFFFSSSKADLGAIVVTSMQKERLNIRKRLIIIGQKKEFFAVSSIYANRIAASALDELKDERFQKEKGGQQYD